MAACMMLVDPKYAYCGRVYNKDVGPFKFCVDCLADNDLTLEVANEHFDQCMKTLDQCFTVLNMHILNKLCVQKDIIYEDLITHKIQNFLL